MSAEADQTENGLSMRENAYHFVTVLSLFWFV